VSVTVKSATVAHWENSEVLPLGSVAVALIDVPVGKVVGKLAVKLASPLPSVVATVDPRNASPSP
jgi:hypothetical protein